MEIEHQKINQNNLDFDEISLKDLIFKLKEWVTYLKSKWRIILTAGIIGGIIALIFVWFDKPLYKANLTFAMEEDKGGGGLGGALGLANSIGIDLGAVSGGGAFAAGNLGELMKSRLIIEKVLLEPINIKNKRTTLLEYYIEKNSLREIWKKNYLDKKIQFLPDADRSKFSFKQDSILQQIHKTLINSNVLNIFQKDKKVTILTIEFKNEDELFAKLFCENLAKETSDFYIETKSKKARINVDVLQKQLDSVRSDMNNAIIGVAAEVDNVFNLNPALNIKGASSKKKQIDVQANMAIITNLVVQLELAKITLRKETPLIQLIDKPIMPLEIEKKSRLKSFILGSFIAAFLSILFLIFKQFLLKIDDLK